MDEFYEPVTLSLEPDEAAAIVDALHAFILERISFCLISKGWRDTLAFDDAQSLLHSAAQAYTKAFLLVHENEPEEHVFTQAFSLTPKQWDYLADLAVATSWDDLKRHNVCRCGRCDDPEKKMKHGAPCQCELCREIRTSRIR